MYLWSSSTSSPSPPSPPSSSASSPSPASRVAFCGRNHSATVITSVSPSCPSQCVPALTRDNSHCPPALMNQCLPLFVSSGDTHDPLFAAEQRGLANHHSCIVLTSTCSQTICVPAACFTFVFVFVFVLANHHSYLLYCLNLNMQLDYTCVPASCFTLFLYLYLYWQITIRVLS